MTTIHFEHVLRNLESANYECGFNEAKEKSTRQNVSDREINRRYVEEAFDALLKFKEYVHKRLDDAGIPTHPDGEHSKHGCRIGDRLDIALGVK